MLPMIDAVARATVRTPLLLPVCGFIAGLLVGRMFAVPVIGVAVVVVVIIVVMWVALRSWDWPHRWVRGLLLPAALFCCGVAWWQLRDPFRTLGGNAGGGERDLLVRLCDPSFIGDRSCRFEAVILRDGSDANSGARVLVTFVLDSGSTVPQRNDRIALVAEPRTIDRVPDPGGFDRRAYALSRAIALECFVPKGDWRIVGHATHWTDAFASARAGIAHWLEASGLPLRERALAKALLIGVRDELDADQKTAFARSGTMHVLAVSGAHVGIIWAVLNFLLKRLGNRTRPRIVRSVLILMALWGYAGLTGAEPSVLRATVMCSLFTLGGMLLRTSGHLNSLFASALVLLVWDPIMLWQLSFQLSFLAVFGIILFYRPLLRLWHPPTWLLHQVWSITCVSLAAQLTTTPLSLFVFKSFPIWFLPANIVVGLVVTVAVYGCALLILFFKVPLIGAGLTWCMTQLLLFLGWSTTLFADLPLAYPAVRIGTAQCLLLYGFVFATAACIAWPGRAARWCAGVTLLAVLVAWATHAHRVNGAHRLAVHDTFTGPVLSFQHGRHLSVVADSAETAKPSFDRKIEAQVRTQGAHRVSLRPFAAIANSGAFRSGRWLVGIAGKGTHAMRTPLKVDALLVPTEGSTLDELLGTFTPTHGIVLLPGMDGLARYRLRKACEERGIACHDVKRQGAFILEEHD